MPDADIYGNAVVPPDGSGFEDEDFDGEALVAGLFGLDDPVSISCEDDEDEEDD